MSITTEAKRVKAGESLTSFQNQIITTINQLSGIKTNLLNLKTQITEDADYSTEDVTAVSTVISELETKITTLVK